MTTRTLPKSEAPSESQQEVAFGAKVQMVMETFTDLFGPLEVNVVFQAIANWVGKIIFTTQGSPWQRREVARRFQQQLENVITLYEQGKLP